MSTASVLGEVMTERARQDELHGKDSAANPNLPLAMEGATFSRLITGIVGADFPEHEAKRLCESARRTGGMGIGHILIEEVVEAFYAPDEESCREELKQVAAVCVAAIEAIDARKNLKTGPNPSCHECDGYGTGSPADPGVACDRCWSGR